MEGISQAKIDCGVNGLKFQLLVNYVIDPLMFPFWREEACSNLSRTSSDERSRGGSFFLFSVALETEDSSRKKRHEKAAAIRDPKVV